MKLKYISILLLNLFLSTLSAQLVITSPAVDQRVRSCDDHFDLTKNIKIDMNEPEDLNNFVPGTDISGLSSTSFSGGIFNFTSANTSPTLYLFSPAVCGSYPVAGRWGQDNPVNTSKYNRLAIRMYSAAEDHLGLKMIWDRGCSYANTRSVTFPITVKKGWHVYDLDLNGVSFEPGTNASTWNSGVPINGLALIPTLTAGVEMKIDWISLYDPISCSTASLSGSLTAVGDNNYHSIWLDNDTNPFNGYDKKLVSASATFVSSAFANDLYPGTYNIVGLLDSDYATLELDNPWDFDSANDILTTTGLTSINYLGSDFNATTISNDPSIYLHIGSDGINSSKYTKLSFEVSGSTQAAVYWDNGGAAVVNSPTGLFNLDLATHPATWTGTIRNLIIRPVLTSPTAISLKFVSLRNSGYDTSREAADLLTNVVVAAGDLKINNTPDFEILEPNSKGGVAVKKWDMNPGDIVLTQNLYTGVDDTYPSEMRTSYLPDVREVDGLRGDFFKAISLPGNDDPNNWSSFPLFNSNPLQFSGDVYHNLCFKLNIDTPFDLAEGSVARAIWKKLDGGFKVSEDIVLGYNAWNTSKWQEYCVDLQKIYLDSTTTTDFTGIIDGFRIDSHEFHYPDRGTRFYFDYIKLRKNDSANTKYLITYKVSDPDDTALIDFYYNTSNSTSGATKINAASVLSSSNQRQYLWDTAALPNGRYYVFAIVSDTYNPKTVFASGPIDIDHSEVEVAAPILNTQVPVPGQIACNTLQVKGYSLAPNKLEEISLVEVLIDDVLFTSFKPDLYSLSAVSSYPDLESSNSGFNKLIDITSLADGAHTVKLKSYTSAGASTLNEIVISKAAVGCAGIVSDNAPAGTPIASDVELPTENPTPVASKPKINKFQITSAGKLTLSLSSLTEGSLACNLEFYLADTKGNYGAAFLTSSNTQSVRTYKGTKVLIKKSKVKTLNLKLIKKCSGYADVQTSKKIKVATNSGASSIAAVRKLLKKKIK